MGHADSWVGFLGGAVLLCGLLLLASPATAGSVPRTPLASLIETIPSADGFTVRVVGSAGAVLPSTTITLFTLAHGSPLELQSTADGSFEATLEGSPGDGIEIFHGTEKDLPQTVSGGATTVRIGSAGETLPGGGRVGRTSSSILGGGRFRSEVRIDRGQFDVGDSLSITATVVISSPVVAQQLNRFLSFGAHVAVERFFDEQGREHRSDAVLQSSYLTPTGMPVVGSSYSTLSLGDLETLASLAVTDGSTTTVTLTGTLPLRHHPGSRDLPPGHYRLRLFYNCTIDSFRTVALDRVTAALQGGDTDHDSGSGPQYSPLFRVGDPAPPRLTWMLLADRLSNGSIGAVAREDADRFGLAGYDVAQGPLYLVRDATHGGDDLVPYRLEPYFPTVGTGTRNIALSIDSPLAPMVPSLPLDYTKGSFQVTVTGPDGTPETLGTFSMRQPISKVGESLFYEGEAYIEAQGVTSLDAAARHLFTTDGAHTIEMTGHVETIWGDRLEGGGTYDVTLVHERLQLETATIPGTPFEVGDFLGPAVVVDPGVPAEVALELTFVPGSDPARTVHHRVSGRAGTFGYFAPGPDERPFRFDEPGEYSLLTTAQYWTPQGRLLAGSRQGGGVIAPVDSSLIAHGRRGVRCPSTNRLGFTDQDRFDMQSEGGTPAYPDLEMFYPQHSGDVLYIASDGEAKNRIYPTIRVEDTSGDFPRSYFFERISDPLPSGEDIPNSQVPSDSLPLTLTSPTRFGDSLAYQDEIDRIGYFYTQASRSGFSVRAMVSTELPPAFPYWSISPDFYSAQLGSGPMGDLPGDLKPLYGGAVLRDTTLQTARYAIYGSLAVILPRGSNANRVTPPLQEPVITIRDVPYHILTTWPAVPPGAVLVEGDTYQPSCYVYPPVSASVSVTVTSPSGLTRRFTTQTNKVGFTAAPDKAFRVLEPGLWQVEAVAESGGRSGGYPGAAGRRYQFVVLSKKDTLLDTDVPAGFTRRPPTDEVPVAVRPPAFPARVSSFIRMGEFLLDQSETSLPDPPPPVSYDPLVFQPFFPNLDISSDGTSAGEPDAWDTLNWTLYAAKGAQRSARQIHIRGRGDLWLYPTDENPLFPAKSSRSVTRVTNLHPGLNLITPPLQPSAEFHSAALAAAAGSAFVVRTTTRTATDGLYDISLSGSPTTTFVLEPGRGYLLSVSRACTVTWTGRLWTPSDLTLDLRRGVNFIGFPLGLPDSVSPGDASTGLGSLVLGHMGTPPFSSLFQLEPARSSRAGELPPDPSRGYIVSSPLTRRTTLPFAP